MKRILALFLVFILIFSITACGMNTSEKPYDGETMSGTEEKSNVSTEEMLSDVPDTIPHTVEKKHSLEIQFTVQTLKDIKKLLIKVSDAADFVEILSEIVQMKIDDDISKEKIDEMKVKWKPYKITKKQIVSIYELL